MRRTGAYFTEMFCWSGFTAEVEQIAQAQAQENQRGAAAAVSDRMMDAVCLVGPRSRCQERLAAFREAGVTYPLLGPQAAGEDFATAARQVIAAFSPGEIFAFAEEKNRQIPESVL